MEKIGGQTGWWAEVEEATERTMEESQGGGPRVGAELWTGWRRTNLARRVGRLGNGESWEENLERMGQRRVDSLDAVRWNVRSMMDG